MDTIPHTKQALKDYIHFAGKAIKANEKKNRDLKEMIDACNERLDKITRNQEV